MNCCLVTESCLTLLWPWKIVTEPWKMLGFLASGGEEFNPGLVTRLGRSLKSFCVITFYWSLKETEKASDIDIKKGQKECQSPSPLPLAVCYIPIGKLLIRERRCPKTQSGTRPLSHNTHFEITLAPGESPRAIKRWTWILKKGRFPSKYIVLLT